MPVNRATTQRGFTLIEIIIVIAILGILGAIAMPSFNVWRQNAQVRSDARMVMGALQQARVEAVTRNAVVSVTFNIDGSWDVHEVGVGLIREGSFPPESASSFTNQSFAGVNDNITMFNSRGLTQDGANVAQDGSIRVAGARTYEISVSPAGNVSISLIL